MSKLFDEAYNEFQTEKIPPPTPVNGLDENEQEFKIGRINPTVEKYYAQRQQGLLPKEEFEEPETNPQYFARGAARTLARSVEEPFNFIEGIRNLAGSGIEKGYETVTGKELGPEGKENIRTGVRAMTYGVPGGSDIRKAEQKVAGKYLEPKTPGEGMWDEVTQDIVGTLLPFPGGRAISALEKFGRAIGGAFAGQYGKQVVKERGGSEGAQEGTKQGIMFLSQLINPGGALEHLGNMRQEAEHLIPQTLTADARPLERHLTEIRRRAMRGTLSTDERAIADEAQAILDKIQNGQLTYHEAIASRVSLNKKVQSLYRQPIEKEGRNYALRHYNQIRNGLNGFLDHLEHINPRAYQLLRQSDQGFTAYLRSRAVSHSIERMLPKIAQSEGLSPAFLGAMFGAGGATLAKVPKVAAGIGAASTLLHSGELAARVVMSPTLRSYYMRALRQATAQNLNGFVKTAKQLQEKIEEDPSLAKFLSMQNEKETNR